MSLYWLGNDRGVDFPPVDSALTDPNGLLAAGGDLSPQRLLAAYQTGVFPWYSEGQPILWWTPDPRTVLTPSRFHLSRSLRKSIRRDHWELTVNQAFSDVVAGCAAPRPDQEETWITAPMRDAYGRLHELGWAHSVEVWQEQQLVGGIYGVAIDRLFCGESMFMRKTNASKVALFALCKILARDQFELLDCQMYTQHLASLGAEEVTRARYVADIATLAARLKPWHPDPISTLVADLL